MTNITQLEAEIAVLTRLIDTAITKDGTVSFELVMQWWIKAGQRRDLHTYATPLLYEDLKRLDFLLDHKLVSPGLKGSTHRPLDKPE